LQSSCRNLRFCLNEAERAFGAAVGAQWLTVW